MTDHDDASKHEATPPSASETELTDDTLESVSGGTIHLPHFPIPPITTIPTPTFPTIPDLTTL